MKRSVWVWLVVSLCLGSWAGVSRGATVSGRLTTSAYSWQVREVDGTVTRHLRAYQILLLNAGDPGKTGISFHTYARVAGDLLHEGSGQDKYRVYNAYLSWHPETQTQVEVDAGRQQIFAGVGYGTIDGVQVQVSPRKEFRLVGYGGMLVPLVPDDGIGTWDQGHMWGLQALLDVKETSVGISYADRARASQPYVAPGRYSGLLLTNGDRRYRRLGVDVRRTIDSRLELDGSTDIDLEAEDVHAVDLSANLQATPKMRISAEYDYRKPDIYLNSILSVFEASNNQEVGARVFYHLSSRMQLSGNAYRVMYDGASSWRLGASLTVGKGTLGYSRRLGYGGDNDAVSIGFDQPVTRELSIRTEGSIAGYRLYEDKPTRDRAYAGSLGLTYRPRKTVSLDVDWQVLRNRYYGHDSRLFVRGSVWFFKRGQ